MVQAHQAPCSAPSKGNPCYLAPTKLQASVREHQRWRDMIRSKDQKTSEDHNLELRNIVELLYRGKQHADL